MLMGCLMGGLNMHRPMIHKRDVGPYPVMCRCRLLGEDSVSREIGAPNAGMRIKFAAGDNSWIVATGGGGTVFGAEDPSPASRCKYSCTPVPGTSSQARVVSRAG